jgi:hypothetical protein
MATVLPRPLPTRPTQPPPQRLPLRWAVIALLVVLGGGIGLFAAGPLGAVLGACATAGTSHRIIA